MGFHKGLQIDHAVGNGRWRRLLVFLSLHPLTAREPATRRAAAMVYTQFLYFIRRPYFLLSEEAADAAEEAEERDFERESVTSFVMSVPP